MGGGALQTEYIGLRIFKCNWENRACSLQGHEDTYTEDVERSDDHQGKEQGIVVKDREGGGLVLGDLRG